MKEWKPWPRQKLFLRLPWYEVLFGGAKGPGKTDALLADASGHQIKNPNYHGIIFRRTFPKLQEIIDRSLKWFTSEAKYNEQKHRWTWPNGAKLSFRSCLGEADKYDYQGHEYQFMGFDQLEEFTESQYLFLIMQNRTTDPSLKCYVRATSNPGNVGHLWVKKRFIDPLDRDGTPQYYKRVRDEFIETSKRDPKALSRAFVFSTLDDNPSLLENDPEYVNRLDMLPDKERRALRFGDWDVFEGQFFDSWDRNIHIVAIPEGLQNEFISIDYGYSKPASVGWYKIGIDGKVVRYKELYVEKATYSALGKMIMGMTDEPKDVEYAVGDPAMWGDRAHHKDGLVGESGAEILQDILGDITLIRGDNVRNIGWGRCREYLEPYEDQHGQTTAMFGVTKNCVNFIRTVPAMVHSQSKPEDLDTNGEDHPADEFRYAVMSRPEKPVKEKEVHVLSRDELIWKRAKEQAQRNIKSRKYADSELVGMGG